MAVPARDGGHPTVAIVSVNHNGGRYLGDFLASLEALDYPADRVRIVLVDNASADGSVELVRERFPRTHLIEVGANVGFAAGCNVGIGATTTDYVALVNNDTVVEPSWLRALVEVAESDARVGMVGSKMLFFTPFLDVRLNARAPAGVALSGVPLLALREARVETCDYDKLVVRRGHVAWSVEPDARIQWIEGETHLAVPIAGRRGGATLVLTARSAPGRGDQEIAIAAGPAKVGSVVATEGWSSWRLAIPAEVVEKAAHDLINNAGTLVDAEGRFGDRGIFEFDRGQYDEVMDVPALCGGSMLLRRAMLQRIGAFDARYFMYFEDLDLSWRAREAGWRIVYTPRSRLRHIHAGSSREGSPLWLFYVTRNHLFWLVQHGRAPAAARAVGRFYARATSRSLQALRERLRGRGGSAARDLARADMTAARSLTRHLPALLAGRVRKAVTSAMVMREGGPAPRRSGRAPSG
jgi:GT2 family glycosyltransferase